MVPGTQLFRTKYPIYGGDEVLLIQCACMLPSPPLTLACVCTHINTTELLLADADWHEAHFCAYMLIYTVKFYIHKHVHTSSPLHIHAVDKDADGSISSEECMEMIMHRFGRYLYGIYEIECMDMAIHKTAAHKHKAIYIYIYIYIYIMLHTHTYTHIYTHTLRIHASACCGIFMHESQDRSTDDQTKQHGKWRRDVHIMQVHMNQYFYLTKSAHTNYMGIATVTYTEAGTCTQAANTK
jgi:hypothetical protein